MNPNKQPVEGAPTTDLEAYLGARKEGREEYLKSYLDLLNFVRQIDASVAEDFEKLLAYVGYWDNDPFARAPRDMYADLNSAIISIKNFLKAEGLKLDEQTTNRVYTVLEFAANELSTDIRYIETGINTIRDAQANIRMDRSKSTEAE